MPRQAFGRHLPADVRQISDKRETMYYKIYVLLIARRPAHLRYSTTVFLNRSMWLGFGRFLY